jgi:hypothetical protein
MTLSTATSNEELTGRIATALGLFSSCIKSGEDWSPQCEQALRDAFDALTELGERASPRADRQRVETTEQTVRERLRAFYEPDEIELWMCSPQPSLDFRTALQEIREGRAHEVERLIAQLEDGAYI